MSIIWTAVERNLTAIGGDPRVVRLPRTLDRTDAVNDELVVRSSLLPLPNHRSIQRGMCVEVGPQLRNRVGNASSEWRDDRKYKRHGSAETVHDRIFTPRRLSPHIYIIELAGAVLERDGFSCVMRNLG